MARGWRGKMAALATLFVALLAAFAPKALAQSPSSVEAGYVLGVGDRMRVIVFGEAELSGEFQVDSTGRVSMPLVGQIKASGETISGLQRTIEAELRRQEILTEPRVNVEVLNFRPFYILGEVRNPGEYPYSNGLGILTAVAKAGGFAPLANQYRAAIKRTGDNKEVEVSITEPVAVGPGDTIRILKGAFYILGEVNRPGEYPFSPGLTFDNAVATAGGFTYRANRGKVFIKRQGEAQERSYPRAPNLVIEPGDTVRVGERLW